MNYQAFTNDSLVMMHHAAQGALAVDDELNKLGQQARFRVRETLDWVKHAADLEAEMFRRGMIFDGIVWAKQQHSVSDAMAAPQNEVACSPPSTPLSSCKSGSVDGARSNDEFIGPRFAVSVVLPPLDANGP
jgi:hypothetical protein